MMSCYAHTAMNMQFRPFSLSAANFIQTSFITIDSVVVDQPENTTQEKSMDRLTSFFLSHTTLNTDVHLSITFVKRLCLACLVSVRCNILFNLILNQCVNTYLITCCRRFPTITGRQIYNHSHCTSYW